MSTTKTQSTTRKSTRKAPVEQPEVNLAPKINLTNIDANQYVVVRNGFQGQLVYRSRKTGELFTWEEFGDEQEMELRELRNAKSSAKAFFSNNWFMFDEDWIIDYLGVGNFYKTAIPIEGFDDLFSLDAESIKETIAGLSDGQKESVAYRARDLVAEDRIDSKSVIKALESSLGITLAE